jgi:hypothetical protein
MKNSDSIRFIGINNLLQLRINRIILIIACFFIFSTAKSQVVDIENLISNAQSQPFKISGGISADMLYTESENMGGTGEQPFQYFLNGNVTATFFGQLSVPLSFSYSNRKFNTRYPKNQQNFNRFGISPKYKWITVHGGWRSMRFSPYSLNGHNFLGGGVELTPGNYEIKMMHGRLLQTVIPDTTIGNKPCFERWGSGLQFIKKYKGNKYGFSIFHSADKQSSITEGLDNEGITPEENFVTAITLMQKVSRLLSFSLDYASSNLNADSRVDNDKADFFSDNFYIKDNSTTKRYNALKTAFNFSLDKMNIGVGYERVDPGYESHGAYFYNNDFENITLNYSSPFFKNKVNLNTSLGLERDNISKTKTSTANRIIGMVNLSWIATEKLQFNTNYSNFRNVAEFNPYANLNPSLNPYDNVDSLRFVQVSQNTSLNMIYNTSTETVGQSLSVFMSMVQTNNEIGGETQNTGVNFYNGSISYNYNIIPKNISITSVVNVNWSEMATIKSGMAGPSLGINTKIFKIINTGLVYTQNFPLGENQNSGKLHRLQYRASTTIMKKHNVNLSVVWQNRELKDSDNNKTTNNNFMLRLSYAYSF